MNYSMDINLDNTAKAEFDSDIYDVKLYPNGESRE